MINWGRVNELRDEIGPEDFDEVVGMFLEEVDEVIERLQQNPDPASYEQDLHFIKGSAMNLGFASLVALCQLGEKRAAKGDASSIELSDVFETYARSKAEFSSQQDQHLSAA